MDMGLAIFLTSVTVAGIILVIVVISFGHQERMKKLRLRELELKENAYRQDFEDDVDQRLSDLSQRLDALNSDKSKEKAA